MGAITSRTSPKTSQTGLGPTQLPASRVSLLPLLCRYSPLSCRYSSRPRHQHALAPRQADGRAADAASPAPTAAAVARQAAWRDRRSKHMILNCRGARHNGTVRSGRANANRATDRGRPDLRQTKYFLWIKHCVNNLCATTLWCYGVDRTEGISPE